MNFNMKGSIGIIIKTVMILLCFIIILIGCDFKVFYWEFAYEADRVTSVKVIDATNAHEYEVIKELDAKFIDEVYYDIENLKMERYGPNLSHPSGVCFLVVFDTGEYDIISKKESKHFKYIDGKISSYNSWLCCDSYDFNKLVEKYE